MKKLKWIDKVLFILNILGAFTLLLVYLLPFIPPKSFPFLAILSLGMPVLLTVNLLFVVYWLVRLKRQVFLSLIVLAIGFTHITSLFNFNITAENEKHTQADNELSILSYNVRLFNKFNWLDTKNIKSKIINFVNAENPDIVFFQEFTDATAEDFEEFDYAHIDENSDKGVGQAIFSKYEMVDKGRVEINDQSPRAIYADILYRGDTIRLFNIHLESLKIESKVEELQKEDSKRLIKRVGHSFVKQQIQASQIKKQIATSPYKTILGGDFNNSAYSYVYRQLSSGRKDCFKRAGEGFGKTFVFDFIPIRIDFMLVNSDFNVVDFKNYDLQLSDHYPVKTKLSLNN